jgi:hypothetical protein
LKVRTVLLIVLVVLIAVFVIIRFGTGRRGGEEPLFADFAPEKAARFVLEGADTTVVLGKTDDVWFATSEDSFPAEARAIEDMLAKVSAFSRKDIISSNPDKQALYQVDSMGVFVTIQDAGGDTLVRFVVGKPGPDYRSTYVRDFASNDVVLASGYLRPVFDRGKRTWQDRTVFSAEPDAILEMEITRPGEAFTLAMNDAGEWFISRPESASCDQAAANRLVRTLAYLRADDLAGRMPLPASGLAGSDSSVAFRTVAGIREVLLFGNQVEERRTYAKRAESDIVYLLATHRVGTLLPRLADLLAVEAEPVEEGEGGEGL